ncbi:MAG TPA: hypothetical protein VLN59_16730 [Burkholderiales bacterium]|nr:hypothetical protein [Burkholderiales bacterium]
MLTTLAQSSFSTWLLKSGSIWAYPTVLTLHTFGMMLLVGVASMVDLRILGFGRAIPLQSMDRLFRIVWSAFALNAVTGTMLFIASADTRGPDPVFWTKLAFVAIGLITAGMIRRANFSGNAEPVVISSATKRLALVSLFAWCAAITAGRLLAYTEGF